MTATDTPEDVREVYAPKGAALWLRCPDCAGQWLPEDERTDEDDGLEVVEGRHGDRIVRVPADAVAPLADVMKLATEVADLREEVGQLRDLGAILVTAGKMLRGDLE